MLDLIKDLKEVNNHKVVHMDTLKEEFPEKFNESGSMNYEWFEKEIRPHNHIYIRHDKNSISFTIQNGPIKENGHNGVQIDEVIETTKILLEAANKKFPCRENAIAITKLDEALLWLMKRKNDRKKRGVEGLSKL